MKDKIMHIPFIRKPQKIFTDYAYRIHYDNNKREFDYFEKTPYFEIDFDDSSLYSMIWWFFTDQGVAYFLGALIKQGYNLDYNYERLSSLHNQFIEDFHRHKQINIDAVLKLLTKKQRAYLTDWFTYLLDNLNEDILYIRGKKFKIDLQKNIDYLKEYEINKDEF